MGAAPGLFRHQLALRLAAIPGGYVLASLAMAALVRLVPVAPVEAVSIGFIAFFPVYAALIIWAFASRHVVRMWTWWLAADVVLAVAVAASIAATGRA